MGNSNAPFTVAQTADRLHKYAGTLYRPVTSLLRVCSMLRVYMRRITGHKGERKMEFEMFYTPLVPFTERRIINMKKLQNIHDNIKAEIRAGKTIAIYGAGLMGRQLKKILEDEPYCGWVSYFVVKSMEGNPDKIDEVPVIELRNAAFLKKCCVLVALHEKSIDSALKELRSVGFEKLIPVSFDNDIWCEMRKNHIRKGHMGQTEIFPDLDEALKKRLHVYVAKSIFDKEIQRDTPYTPYEIPIQVGSVLTDKKICDIRDDWGDNISCLNRQYCELTALYWIWKHDHAEYTGICHYRRRYTLNNWEFYLIGSSNVDAVLTVPVYNLNTVRGQYGLDHEIEDWDIMMSAIRKLYPEYLPAAKRVQIGEWYYAYNMMISKKTILNEYCAWLFPILDYCTKNIGIKADAYQNRYPGFLAERLMTIFFEHNRERFNIMIGEKKFID